ncbi:MAG: NADH-quinone oxidoreductase subunit M [Propionibacteriaceae bacterium]|jgi:NADH-quinone oxidoreductase subunit M|nr:NADH-quinone oxidoreductase subunit M [Propionibacteriaceae bacterium]
MIVPWLTLVIAIPLFGAVVALPLRGVHNRRVGLVTSGLTLALAIAAVVLSRFYDLSEQVLWLRSVGAWYALNIDGLSGSLLLVITALVVAVLLIRSGLEPTATATATATERINVRPEIFTVLVLCTEACISAALLAADLVLFCIAFEMALLPCYALVGCWGGAKRTLAAARFLAFTLTSGFLLLAGVIGMLTAASATGRPSTLLSALGTVAIPEGMGRLLFVLFFLAFAIKGPLVPFHSWLPLLAREAHPLVTTVIVAVVDVLGGYGMIRFAVGLFPAAAAWAAPAVLVLALISIWYAGIAAAGSRHLLQFGVYTSISHTGFIMFGIFALTPETLTGAAMYLSAHAVSVAALLLVGTVIWVTTGTAHIGEFAGLGRRLPVLAGLFLISGLATLALPGFLNFAAELQVLVGAWEHHRVLTLLAIGGTLLGAVYVTLAYQRLFTGQPSPDAPPLKDASLLQRGAIGVLLAATLLFGCAPELLREYVAEADLGTAAIAAADAADAGGK